MLVISITALLTTMIIGYLYETFKEYATMRDLKRANEEIDRVFHDANLSAELDVFMVNRLREIFVERLLNTHVIDEFKIYKKDNRHIAMTYRKKMAIQNLELCFDQLHRCLEIGASEYIENPFEEIHL